MKILVCISSVPDTTSKINFTADKSAFDKNGIQWVINPLDEFMLTRAVQLQQSNGASVTVMNIGTADTEPVIRKALAIGANDAIRVNLDPKDSLSTAKEIAAVAQNGGYDLIFMGRESIDYNGTAVPGMVAQMLGMTFLNSAVGLKMEGSEVNVLREIDGGRETVSAQMPLVVAGQKGFVDEKELIIPNMRGIMGARTKPLEVKEAANTETAVSPVSFENAPPRAAVKMVSPDNLDELVRLLHEEAKVI